MTDQPAPDRYDRILHAVGSVFDKLGAWPDHPRALESLADAVEQLIDAEVEASRRRTIALVERIDDGRAWARRNLTVEQQAGLFAALRGYDPNTKCRRCHCPAGSKQCDHCNCCDVPDRPTAELAEAYKAVYARADRAEAALAALEPPQQPTA